MVWVKQIKDFASNVVSAVSTRLLPSGGTAGQIPVKNSNTEGDIVWQTPTSATKAEVEAARIRAWFL